MTIASVVSKKLAGNTRRGAQMTRRLALINAATRVFIREGYDSASMDKVAAEAGVSKRAIYECYVNKAGLLSAVAEQVVDRDLAAIFVPRELDHLPARDALLAIGQAITGRARDRDAAARLRIVTTESRHFPEIARKIREGTKSCIESAIESYFRVQFRRGTLRVAEPGRAARLYVRMVCAELYEHVLFGLTEDVAEFDFGAHLSHVVDVFLNGVASRT
jgi:TetR/AcrR family transcriptional repressor of mexJK operon